MAVAGLGVYEALLERSWAVRLNDPQVMIHFAEVAVDLAQGLPSRGHGVKRVADFQARALGELANAYRTADRLRSAQQTFGHAYFWLHRGTGDPYLRARVFDLEASLLGVLREYVLALRRLESLSDLYLELGEPHLAGRASMKQALYTYYSGEVIPAFELNAQAMALLDRERDPIVYMMAVHNHLLYLVDLEQYSWARRVLFENQRNLIYKNRVMALRLRDIEGRISYGVGKLVSAEIAFREVKEGTTELGMSFYAALAALEHAMVLLTQGLVEEAEAEVIEVRETFLAQELYREHLGAVIFLEECFRRRRITVGLIHSTIAYLRRVDLHVEPHKLRS
jgi:hypothetical protein